jgi:hypothetical protein
MPRSAGLFVTESVFTIASAALKSSLLFQDSGSSAKNPEGKPRIENSFLLDFMTKSASVLCCLLPCQSVPVFVDPVRHLYLLTL